MKVDPESLKVELRCWDGGRICTRGKVLEERRLEREGANALASPGLLQDTHCERPDLRQRGCLRENSGDLLGSCVTVGRKMKI